MRTRTIATLASAIAALALAGPAPALGAPVLEISSTHKPPHPVPVGTYAKYELAVSNSGTSETSGNVTVEFTAAVGLEVVGVSTEKPFGLEVWSCSIADPQSAECEGPEGFTIGPGKEACQAALGASCHVFVTVKTNPSIPLGPAHSEIKACGGGAAACTTAADDPLEIVPFDFDLHRFDGTVLKKNGNPSTQAGAHPYTAATQFYLSAGLTESGASGPTTTVSDLPLQQLKDAIVRLPAGFVGNPEAIQTCTQAQLATRNGNNNNCPPESQVGEVIVQFVDGQPLEDSVGVYNMQRASGSAAVPIGTPALFAFNYSGVRVQIYAKVRTGDDYGVTVITKNAGQTLAFEGIEFTFWGIPADPSHDADRFCPGMVGPKGEAKEKGCSSKAPLVPFLSLPTSCIGESGPGTAVRTFLDVTSWAGGSASASFLSHDNEGNPIGAEGCNAVDFSPTLEARPTTSVADSPSGLDFDLHVPQNENPNGTVEAHLRDTTVTLPEGLVINPSGANGLDGCSLSEFGFTSTEGNVIHTTPQAATCPNASKLGSVEVDSPLVDHPLKGSVHIADPYANPFGSLLAIYITLDDPETGTVVKLAGKVSADPGTGQLTTTVTENPQLPFEDFKLHFFGGAGGSLRTPAVCGNYTTSSSLTPWSAPDSGPPATPSDPWAITQAPGGAACPTSQDARPNTPDLDAGAVSPIAAAHTPTVVNLRRADGSQEFSAVNITLPPGMTGKLAGVATCLDSALASAAAKTGREESSSPSCPAASRIGTVDVAAGAGPAPYHAQGIAYLSGPYKGAPISMAIITPATAGPFDLGTVAVRVALQVNSESAQITAISDPLPSILQGIPLDIRSAQVKLDRPDFTLNGTSCDPLAFSGSLLSTLGQGAPLTERFQLGECGRLAFKPKLGIRLTGGTRRGAHPALKATLTMPPGGANIAKASVALPHSEFLDQAHIGTVCTRVQFAADQCPAASVYGHATATSPLVDYAVQGPVYLRSSSHELPDLVMALKGPPSQPVQVDAVARTDSVNGGIRSTFEAVPDLPLTQVVLEMAGGRKGLLQNSTNICKGKHVVTAEFEAQNGKAADLKPALKAQCKKPRKANKRAVR